MFLSSCNAHAIYKLGVRTGARKGHFGELPELSEDSFDRETVMGCSLKAFTCLARIYKSLILRIPGKHFAQVW